MKRFIVCCASLFVGTLAYAQKEAITPIGILNISKEAKPTNEAKQPEVKLISSVDKNIPVSGVEDKNTFALIIANENYTQVAKVPYANNDGFVFSQYCNRTLGIPERNIRFIKDATSGMLREAINWLADIMRVYGENAKVIVYYAGHGIPDEASRSAYLLPVDCSGKDKQVCYKLDDLYQKLGSTEAERITVIIDACFSGSTRNNEVLSANARGVALKAKPAQATGKMVVFTAASGDETAYPMATEGHGMFTYFLLKKLQETSGNVTYQELGNYLRQEVSRNSIVLNSKSQTPTVTAGQAAANWESWKMK